MATTEERMKILKMIEEGKISAEEGARLLAAMGKEQDRAPRSEGANSMASDGARFFRVRVTDTMTGQQKVGVNIPIGLVNFGLRFMPNINGIDSQSIRDAINSGMVGRIVDVHDDDDGNRVEIFIE